MGNAPLPKPLAPTERRVVLPIATSAGVIATRLLVHPPLPLHHHNGVVEETEQETSNNENAVIDNSDNDNNVRQQHQERDETDETSAELESQKEGQEQCVYPYPRAILHRTTVSREEYQSKLSQLQDRLDQVSTPAISLGLLLFSSVAVLVFVILVYVPTGFNLQESPLMDHALYLLLIGAGIIGIYVVAYAYSRRQIQQLLVDVEDMFRCWRRPLNTTAQGHDDDNGNTSTITTVIHVTLKRVSHVDIYNSTSSSTTLCNPTTITTTNNSNRTNRRVQSNCFCLVMQLVDTAASRGDMAGTTAITTPVDVERGVDIDAMSLGTLNTNDSDE